MVFTGLRVTRLSPVALRSARLLHDRVITCYDVGAWGKGSDMD